MAQTLETEGVPRERGALSFSGEGAHGIQAEPCAKNGGAVGCLPPAGMELGRPFVATDETRGKIDRWVAVSPDTRVVESTQAAGLWTSQAIEDGEVRYEETEFGGDEPELSLLAKWCEKHTKVEPRPPVKASGVPISGLPRKRSN